MSVYSIDLRKRVIKDCDAGLPTKQVAEKRIHWKAWEMGINSETLVFIDDALSPRSTTWAKPT